MDAACLTIDASQVNATAHNISATALAAELPAAIVNDSYAEAIQQALQTSDVESIVLNATVILIAAAASSPSTDAVPQAFAQVSLALDQPILAGSILAHACKIQSCLTHS